MMLTVCTVLRSGGIYEPRHVERLRMQVEQHLPGALFVALSDCHLKSTKRVQLKFGSLIGWWAKMELFRDDLSGDILYFDLDTEIVGSLADIASVSKLTVLRDPYARGTPAKPFTGIGSGVMYLPEADRAMVWEAWNKSNKFLTVSAFRAKGLGDQAFLQPLFENKADRWQDVLPGQLLSYKVDCNPKWRTGATGKVPEGARVVYAHGSPKPWSADWRLVS